MSLLIFSRVLSLPEVSFASCSMKRRSGVHQACEIGMTPDDEPTAIEYKRWRNKRADYTVVVLAVHHSEGKHGWFSHVTVLGSRTSKDKRVVWPAKVFLRTFEPIGRKIKIPSRWERILKEG